MSDRYDDNHLASDLGVSVLLHVLLVAALSLSWLFHSEIEETKPMAIMKASLYHAPKSDRLVNRTRKEKTETPKVEPKPDPKPEPVVEPPKPKAPEPPKPEIKPVDTPSPIAAPKEPPKPKEPEKPKPKEPEKKAAPEPPKEPKKVDKIKDHARKGEMDQDAKSKKATDKMRKEAEAAIENALEVDADVPAQEGDAEGDMFAELIKLRVEENWSRPPSARNGMIVVLKIELLSNGKVADVQVVESSGNVEFDMSAENAVRRAEDFGDIVKQMMEKDPKLFDKEFRKFTMKFNPGDRLP